MLKVGIVDFLNSRPLAWSFLAGDFEDLFSAVYTSPARVAELLAEGEIDIGLVPSIEVLRIPDLEILPGPCVAATREVRSVLLLSRGPLAEAQRIAVDTSSRTSVALLHILLAELYHLEIELEPAPPCAAGVPPGYDGALIIGDPALKVDRRLFEVVDLAAAWRELTGLPFVFAVWAVRREKRKPGIEQYFERSLTAGLAALERIGEEAAAEQGLPLADVHRYLRQNLRFRLDVEEISGLREFFRRASEHGLTSEDLPATIPCYPVEPSVESSRDAHD